MLEFILIPARQGTRRAKGFSECVVTSEPTPDDNQARCVIYFHMLLSSCFFLSQVSRHSREKEAPCPPRGQEPTGRQ